MCRQLYDEEHDKESTLFDNLGRLLAEVKAFARCAQLSRFSSLPYEAHP